MKKVILALAVSALLAGCATVQGVKTDAGNAATAVGHAAGVAGTAAVSGANASGAFVGGALDSYVGHPLHWVTQPWLSDVGNWFWQHGQKNFDK